jgi:hypothetical protein
MHASAQYHTNNSKSILLYTPVSVPAIIRQPRICRQERSLAAYVERIVHLPERLTHLACRVKQALKNVLKNAVGAETRAHRLDTIRARVDEVRADFEDVGHDEVEEVQ